MILAVHGQSDPKKVGIVVVEALLLSAVYPRGKYQAEERIAEIEMVKRSHGSSRRCLL